MIYLNMESIKMVLANYEKKCNVTLPEVLKFNLVNNIFSSLLPKYYNDLENFYFPIVNNLEYITKDNDTLYITDIIRAENLSTYLNAFYLNMDKDIYKEFFPISLEVFPYSSWLLIGVADKNYNEVWMTSPGAGRDLIFLQYDFYNFLNNLKPIYSEDFNKYNFYKNYNEDFWRIKE